MEPRRLELTGTGPRIAIIGTPRSGNTWLMHLLATLYAVPVTPVPNASAIDWADLPPGCALQVHCHRSPDLVHQLARYGFHVVVAARHPLDVLLSILHFCLSNHTTKWLDGEGGDESSIFGVLPRSRAFWEYASGRRAAALLQVSREWWHDPGSCGIRYEDLNRDPHHELQRLVDAWGVAPPTSVTEAVAANTIPQLRQRTGNNTHFWVGKADLWKSLLPAREASAIAQAVQPSLVAFGYCFDPGPGPDEEQVDHNWMTLVWDELVEGLRHLRGTQDELHASRIALADVQGGLEASRAALAEVRRGLETSQQALHARNQDLQGAEDRLRAAEQTAAELRTQLQTSEAARGDALARLEQTREFLAAVEGLGPLSIRMAHKLRHLAAQYPKTSALARWVARRAG